MVSSSRPRCACVIGILIAFQLVSISNRILTPNGDGRNDLITFVFDNPADLAVSGTVYTVRGALIASMTPGPLPNTLTWNGRANGALVPIGVYVYSLRTEQRIMTGTLVVIR